MQWVQPITKKNNFKPLLHIKIIFNLNEFLLYDFYNFHKNQLVSKFNNKYKQLRIWTTRLFKKINFFFYIKDSINVFRSHTLQFFKISYKTNKRINIFFSGFNGFNTLAYIWFFEFSLLYFLIKIHLSESVSQSLIFLKNKILFINSTSNWNRWVLIHPGQILQILFNLYLIIRVRQLVFKLLKFFKYTKKFFKRTILKSRKYRIKHPKITSQGQYLINSKNHHSSLWEIDYKSLSVVLLPWITPNTFTKAITLFWLNFWNYRLVLWKYII